MKKIAVLLDIPILHDGRVRRVVESLSEQNEVDLFCVKTTFDDSSLFGKNVRVFNYELNINWINRNLLFQKKFENLPQLVLGKNIKYDFIYCNDYPLLEVSVALKEKIGAKLIFDSHEIYIATINQFFPVSGWKVIYGKPLIWLNQWYHGNREKKLVKQVDKMITVCDSLKHYFEEKYHLQNILVVRNCPKNIQSIYKSNGIRQELKLKSDTQILLYQGDVNVSRGVDKVAEAMPLVNEHIHFVVIGGGNKLKEFKDKYSSSRIHFLGKKVFDELNEYTLSADIGILLIEGYNVSKKYALPNKLFEYMAAAKPIISNQLLEPARIINEINCGVLIDDSTKDSIAEAINKVFERNDLVQLGNNGYNAVLNKFNWEVEVQKLKELVANN